MLTWNQTPEPFLSQNPENEHLHICLLFCTASPAPGFWVHLKGHLSTSCKCTHKNGRIKVKSMWYCNYLLLYIATMVLRNNVFLKYLCLTNLGNSQMKFCLSLLSSHRYGLYLCLYLMNAFEIILTEVQGRTSEEAVVQTWNEMISNSLENSKDFFFSFTLYCPLCFLFHVFFFFFFSFMILFLSPFRNTDMSTVMYSCQESVLVINSSS